MKLIIDIPDEEYKTLSKTSEKEKVNELSYYERVIANGTPYEPKGDLISREALKEKITRGMRYAPISENEKKIIITAILSDIDNAPTVETDIEEVAKDAYEHGYTDGWKERFGEPNERPQGEWIEKEETPASVSYYCSVCKIEGIPITPFCPWCGAKMKGGAK